MSTINFNLWRKKMKTERIEAIAESYTNGNISDTKKAVKRMSKADFIDFAEHLRGFYGKRLDQIRHLVD